MARPSKYTESLAAKICAELSQGKSLRTVCAMKGMPSAFTIFKWIGEKEEFSKQYARAKQEAADMLVEEMLDIADDENQETNRSRLRVDTRKWIASKLKPKKYGDRLDLGNTEDGPLKVELVTQFIDGNSKTTK